MYDLNKEACYNFVEFLIQQATEDYYCLVGNRNKPHYCQADRLKSSFKRQFEAREWLADSELLRLFCDCSDTLCLMANEVSEELHERNLELYEKALKSIALEK